MIWRKVFPTSRRETSTGRVVARGKVLQLEGKKFYVRGVTYGPFRPDASGCEYKTESDVERDFAAMAASGVNVVRTYTAVPYWLLDCAQRNGLRLLIGIGWEQQITFLDRREARRSIEQHVRETVQTNAGHPAVLGYSIGNEIPSAIVRRYGTTRVERFIHRLYAVAKREDPDALVTYVNYPTTEYLRLPFIDFLCFNVYLDSEKLLAFYVARLQNIAGDRPLILGELGLDSKRNGVEAQAAVLGRQIRTAFTGGCAGVCVFSWTDEWFRGAHEVEDWGFGLTDRDRNPKIALQSVGRAFSEAPLAKSESPAESVALALIEGALRVISIAPDGRWEFVDEYERPHNLLYTWSLETNAFREVVQELEDILNAPNVREQDLHEFFELHPDLILNDDYQQIHSKIVLESDDADALIPDFVLEPIGPSPLCDLLELKLPQLRTDVTKPRRTRFSAAVAEACAQLRQYRDYFEEKRNRERFQATYKLQAFRPRMFVIIGRRGRVDPIELRRIEGDLPAFHIRTYDDILERAKHKLRFFTRQ